VRVNKIIKATKKFRTTQPRAALGKNLIAFGYQEKPKMLHSVMYACMKQKQSWLILLFLTICASIKEYLGGWVSQPA